MRRITSGLVALALLLGSGLAVAPRALAQGQACFAQTGQCIQGRFLDYWQAHGGLPQFGYPLSGERQELLEDGRTYTVQYFERARMEEHPENPAPWDILLGQFGRRVLRDQFGFDVAAYQAAIAPAQPAAGQAFFPQTGHNVGGRFLAYWQANGGLAQFGYPLTEAFTQGIGGQNYTVQYFERARLELHPENAAPWDVELGQFGRQILAETDRLIAAIVPGTPPRSSSRPSASSLCAWPRCASASAARRSPPCSSRGPRWSSSMAA